VDDKQVPIPSEYIIQGSCGTYEAHPPKDSHVNVSSNNPDEVSESRSEQERSNRETGVHHRQDHGRSPTLKEFIDKPLTDEIRLRNGITIAIPVLT
jgi:hypothetical protein